MTEANQNVKMPKRIHMAALNPYEDRLLAALAFHRFNRKITTQAHHCLSMYLRQGAGRIMDEVGFYADWLGLSRREYLELLYQDGATARQMLDARSAPLIVGSDPLSDLLNGEGEEGFE